MSFICFLFSLLTPLLLKHPHFHSFLPSSFLCCHLGSFVTLFCSLPVTRLRIDFAPHSLSPYSSESRQTQRIESSLFKPESFKDTIDKQLHFKARNLGFQVFCKRLHLPICLASLPFCALPPWLSSPKLGITSATLIATPTGHSRRTLSLVRQEIAVVLLPILLAPAGRLLSALAPLFLSSLPGQCPPIRLLKS